LRETPRFRPALTAARIVGKLNNAGSRNEGRLESRLSPGRRNEINSISFFVRRSKFSAVLPLVSETFRQLVARHYADKRARRYSAYKFAFYSRAREYPNTRDGLYVERHAP
jgi:hypothetical protein